MEGGGEKVRSIVLRVCEVALSSPSDVLVQIVDARNPLLFRCEDLVCLCVYVCTCRELCELP